MRIIIIVNELECAKRLNSLQIEYKECELVIDGRK